MFRYISLGKGESSGDLSKTELNNLTIVGWKVGVVQHAYSEGTVLTASLGSTAGSNAVYNANSIGVPSGAYLWLDIEDYSSSSNVYGFCEAVFNSQYFPALYYGAPGLDATQVEYLLNNVYFEAAWAGCGAPTGIGEGINQGPCDTQMSCDGSNVVDIDEDQILSGKTVQGFIWNPNEV